MTASSGIRRMLLTLTWTTYLLLVVVLAICVLTGSFGPIRVCGEHSTDPFHQIWLTLFIICSTVGIFDTWFSKDPPMPRLTISYTALSSACYIILSFIDGWPMIGTGYLGGVIMVTHIVAIYVLPSPLRRLAVA